MSRFGGVFWFILVIASGMTNFIIKQNVQGLDDQLTHVRKETADEQKRIHDLNTEWTMLNRADLLADLNRTYVHLTPLSPKQVVTNLDSIALRPTPTPPAAPDPAPQIAEVLDAPALPPPAPAAISSQPSSSPAPTRAPALQVAAVEPAPAPPAPRAAASPARPQIAPAAAAAPARPAIAALPLIAAAATAPARPAKSDSLDGLFAQVSGGR